MVIIMGLVVIEVVGVESVREVAGEGSLGGDACLWKRLRCRSLSRAICASRLERCVVGVEGTSVDVGPGVGGIGDVGGIGGVGGGVVSSGVDGGISGGSVSGDGGGGCFRKRRLFRSLRRAIFCPRVNVGVGGVGEVAGEGIDGDVGGVVVVVDFVGVAVDGGGIADTLRAIGGIADGDRVDVDGEVGLHGAADADREVEFQDGGDVVGGVVGGVIVAGVGSGDGGDGSQERSVVVGVVVVGVVDVVVTAGRGIGCVVWILRAIGGSADGDRVDVDGEVGLHGAADADSVDVGEVGLEQRGVDGGEVNGVVVVVVVVAVLVVVLIVVVAVVVVVVVVVVVGVGGGRMC